MHVTFKSVLHTKKETLQETHHRQFITETQLSPVDSTPFIAVTILSPFRSAPFECI